MTVPTLPLGRSLFRAALADPGRVPLGTWVKLPATESMELVALAGFDFAVIDWYWPDLYQRSASLAVPVCDGRRRILQS